MIKEHDPREFIDTINFSGDFQSFMRSVRQFDAEREAMPKDVNDEDNDDDETDDDSNFFESIIQERADLVELLQGEHSEEEKKSAVLNFYDGLFTTHDKRHIYFLIIEYELRHRDFVEADPYLIEGLLFPLQYKLGDNLSGDIYKKTLGKTLEKMSIEDILKMTRDDDRRIIQVVTLLKLRIEQDLVDAEEREKLFSVIFERSKSFSKNILAKLLVEISKFDALAKFFLSQSEEEKVGMVEVLSQGASENMLGYELEILKQSETFNWFAVEVEKVIKEMEKQTKELRREIRNEIGKSSAFTSLKNVEDLKRNEGELRIYLLPQVVTSSKPEYYSICYKNGKYFCEKKDAEGNTLASFDTDIQINTWEARFVDENGVLKRILNNDTSAHIILPKKEYIEQALPEAAAPPSSLFESISKKEIAAVMKKAKINGGVIDGKQLTPEMLKEKGLSPQKKVSFGDTQIYLSQSFTSKEEKRPYKIAYIVKGNKVFCRTIYKSNSHLTWRVIPFSETDRRLGKGDDEHNISVPFSLQQALWQEEFLEAPKTLFDTENEGLPYCLGTAPVFEQEYVNRYDEKNLPNEFYYSGSTDPTFKYETLSGEGGMEFEDKNFPVEYKPDFSQPGKIVDVLSVQYDGKVQVEFLPSKNGKLEYAFFRDKYNRVWMIDPEVVEAGITSYGVKDEYTDFGELNTPAFDYKSNQPSENINFGVLAQKDKRYADAFAYFISKFQLIQEYCESRNIKPEYKTT